MAVALRFNAYPNGLKYASGLDCIELHLERSYEGLLKKPAPRMPRKITFVTRLRRYDGRLITYPPNGGIYISPALYAERTGEKTTLAAVLDELGIKPRQDVSIEMEGDVFRLIN